MALLGGVVNPVQAQQSVARQWNEQILEAIRKDRPNPPVHARNLFHLATVMYDAWAAYDTVAVGFIHHERATAADPEAARREAISYAAYRLLRKRYENSLGKAIILPAMDAQLAALGYDAGVTTTFGNSPAALGNRIAADVMAWGLLDGSNEQSAYTDVDGYVNPQPPLPVISAQLVILGGIPANTDPNRWQPLALAVAFDQNNNPLPGGVQPYDGVSWLHTQAFSLSRTDELLPWIDPGPPSKLGTETDALYKLAAQDVLLKSAQLSDETIIDASPGSVGDNSLGADDGDGRPLNPVIGQPYAPNPVKRGDFVRVMAEFWADGPTSETPPGHWHVLANQASDAPGVVLRIGGTGPVVNRLEWDVKLYFALAGATHNAACAVWSAKRYYEGPRPITMIRYMGSKGQCGDPLQSSYNQQGLLLYPGVVEVITAESSAPGGRHAALAAHVGKIAVFSWPGEPDNPATEVNPVRWMLATDWVPYQRKTFVTPAFPGYISGHSGFSRAAAEILTHFTGSAFCPGGLGQFTAQQNAYLVFEDGPSQTTTLQWATWYDAADLSGQSRRWGGIHPAEDDFPARVIGAKVGIHAWEYANKFWDGSILDEVVVPEVTRDSPEQTTVKWNTVRGMYYRLQRTTNLLGWTDVTSATAAVMTSMTVADTRPASSMKFFRVIRTTGP